MSGFRKFEDIVAWQRARAATHRVYQLTGGGDFSRDFGLRDQIRRASVSIMANIAEGQGRHTNKEFANFINIAHGSIAECQSHLYVALDLGYLDKAAFEELYEAFEEIGRMTMGLMKHLRK